MNNLYKPLVSILLSPVIFFITATSAAAPSSSPQEKYIAKYSTIAVQEMYRSGVPASITLAQGILESSSGRSELAVKGNNHFGIKCHDWKGQKVYFDDDRKGECFRKYDHPEASFKDHSDFLRYRDRYKFLFDLETTDYKGWAYGLKKAGYATDPAYPSKLIKLIEDYDLARFDTMSGSSADSSRDSGNAAKNDRRGRKNDKRKGKKASEDDGRIPDSPTVLEQDAPLEKGDYEKFAFSLSRRMYSRNGVPFIYSAEGETYSTIAADYNLFFREILKFNDIDNQRELLPGTIVYLQSKKRKAAEHIDKHIVDSGDSLWEISQRYGVRLKSLMKMNGLNEESVLKAGDTVILR